MSTTAKKSTTAKNVKIQFTANGFATYSVSQWIFSKDDISVYFDQSLQAEATYSISTPTSDGYDITFTSPPASPVVITILRRVQITDPENFSPGSSLTSEDLNTRFDANYLISVDNKFYSENIEPTYGDKSLTYAAGSALLPSENDLTIPVLSTPSEGESARTWGKDHTGAIIDVPIDPSGKSAAELEAELAAAVSASSSGAKMVGYWNGSSATTVQAELDSIDSKIGDVNLAHYTDPTNKVVIGNGMNATGTSDIVFSSEAVKWTEGSPQPTVAATGNTDVTVATRGWTKEHSITFTKKDSAAEAHAASAADTNPLNFYFSV